MTPFTLSEILSHMQKMEAEKHLEGWGEWQILKLMIKFGDTPTIKQEKKERLLMREVSKRK